MNVVCLFFLIFAPSLNVTTNMDLFDNRYKKDILIGRGAFSEVWKVTDTQTGADMALKIYTVNGDMDDDGIKMLTREFALMIDADHQNLLRPMYFGISSDNKLPYLTLPYCKGGNINKIMGKMTEKEAWKLIRDTASALNYLHAMNPPIIHQDIKPANILIGNDGYYKLSDFGVSIQARSTMNSKNADNAYISAGTISYMAPEKFSRDNLPIMANDIYSLGATVYEMIAGYLPFGVDGGLTQKKGAEVPILPGEFSSQLKQTLEDCLNEEPWKRPTATKLEEIAIDALSKSPTVKMGEIPMTVSGDLIGETDKEETSNTHIEQKSQKKPIIYVAIVAIAIMVLAAYFFLPSQEPVVEQTPPIAIEMEKPIMVEETQQKVKDALQQPVEEVKIKEEPNITKEQKDAKETQNAPEPKPSSLKNELKELDLGYAVWEGKSVNGKPHGYGILTFRDSHRIDSRDEEGRVAHSGDKVKGNYVNGHLDYGTWIKTNGEKIEIFIGQ